MKKIILILLSIFFLSSVYALDCRYKVNETYQEPELGLYDSNGNFIGPPLEFKDFAGGGMNIAGCNPPSFKVHNPLGNDITLNISYTTSWNAPLSSGTQNHQATISIAQYSDSEKLQGTCLDIGGGSISQESINYLITEPELITLENELVTKQREICKICPNGKPCLDDNSLCNSDNECGSSICNIAGFCGHNKTVACEPYGKLNCKNQTCLIPSTKEVGEAYTCEWECKSDRYENGICQKSYAQLQKEKADAMKKLIIFILIILSVVLFIYWRFKKRGADIETERAKIAKEEYDELVKRKGDLAKEISDIENKFKSEKVKKESTLRELDEKLREQKDNFQKEIDYWQEKKKTAKTEARESYNKKIRELESKKGDIKEKLSEVEVFYNKLNDKIQKTEELMTKPFINKQKYRVLLNQEGYEVCSWNKNKLFHIFWYEKNSGEKVDTQSFNVHHIDGDKTNNDYGNLIKIEYYIHKEMHRFEGKWLNYNKGIEILKKYKVVLPEHIQKEIKRRKEQTKLNN